jgi:DtxR family transcriptional regulator, Mn-dependent transcriptional regulator
MTTVAIEDNLKAIYYSQKESDGRVRTSTVAARLDVSSPSTSAMFRRLDHRGLIEREKYRGVTLTAEGEKIAVKTIRHYQLVEAYLIAFFDYPYQAARKEADQLEHHISEKFANRIKDVLENS